MGPWIEMIGNQVRMFSIGVGPYMGPWIEI